MGEQETAQVSSRYNGSLQQVGWIRASDKPDVNGKAKEDPARLLAGQGLGCATSPD